MRGCIAHHPAQPSSGDSQQLPREALQGDQEFGQPHASYEGEGGVNRTCGPLSKLWNDLRLAEKISNPSGYLIRMCWIGMEGADILRSWYLLTQMWARYSQNKADKNRSKHHYLRWPLVVDIDNVSLHYKQSSRMYGCADSIVKAPFSIQTSQLKSIT